MTPSISPGVTFATNQRAFLSPTIPVNVSQADAATFQSLLGNSLKQVSDLQQDASFTIQQSLTGQDISLAESTIAVREADLALRLMMQIQNKLVATWNELKSMQV